MGSLLQNSCLKSANSLRTQLLLSFGTSAFVSLAIVVVLACTSAFFAGRTVKDSAEQLMTGQVKNNLLTTTRLVGEQLDAYMVVLEGTVQLIVETVKDRIVGYPNPGWEDDQYVPFFDMDSQTRMYPLNQPPPPMEWNITPNVNSSNSREHVQERETWLDIFYDGGVSTARAGYFMQGACDPSEKIPSSPTYHPNCTEANNDFETGGVIQQTSTNKGLHQKSGDLSVFLKALWESQHNALSVGVFFHNSGAGSQVMFPGFHLPGQPKPYTSLGCDWMKSINPFTGVPFGTDENIAKCHPNGTLVPPREFNAMERPWCQKFVLNPDIVGWYGPYRSYDHEVAIVTVGKSIFDRRSGEFIGCAGIDISVTDLIYHLDASVLNEHSELLLVSFDDGTLVSDSLNSNVLLGDRPLHVSEIGLIDMQTFKTYRDAVDFDAPWEPNAAEKAFRLVSEPSNKGLITTYPIPIIPEEYNPSYRPKFLVVHSMSLSVFEVVNDISDSIDEDVQRICILAGSLAVFGMILVLSIVWCVSRMLTQPLLWMEGVAWRIVNHADKRSGDALKVVEEEEKSATIRCAPKTEINELVKEFSSMINGFSGEGAAKVADSAFHEIRNELTWHSEFQQLYTRLPKACRSSSGGSDPTDDESSSNLYSEPQGILQKPLNKTLKKGHEEAEAVSLVVPAPVKQNRNPVICNLGNSAAKGGWDVSSESLRVHRSPLFWWIVILIVIPLLLLICVTCAVVSHAIVTTIPSWVENADHASFKLALDSLRLTASSKASLMTAVVFETVRDLHLVTRVAGWLLFGGIQRSTGFTELDTAGEECKIYSPGTCPYYTDSNRTPCPCDWGDLVAETCTKFVHSESRNLQKQFWVLQSQDADPETGRRNNSASFPAVGSTPNTTQYWSDVTLLPGSESGDQAAGYGTSYDRTRVASAAAVANFPVYNYAHSLGWKNSILGVFLGFEEDGLFLGFNGCEYTHADNPFWYSNEENGAAIVAPELCPLGKHGYDPRCRGWYTTARDQYKASSMPVHITSPYQFAIQNEIATSATSPIANPQTGEYVGQTMIDFFPEGVKRGLERVDALISILITPQVDATGGDTVVGPNKTSGWESASILDLLFLHDGPGTLYRTQFEQEVLREMKNGTSDLKEFNRSREDGSTEYLIISFAPVYERVLLPVSPNDFSRGVDVSQVLVYSVGVVHDAEDMHAPFLEIKDDVEIQLNKIRAIYIILTAFVAVLFTAFTCIITVYIVTPVITLLRAVQNINRKVVDDDFPPLNGGSREVHQVYNTFAKLYKVVRISNTAFFSGNHKWAYHFVNDALQLFRKVNDQKAVGIACNNLGNTLFAIYYDGGDDIGFDNSGVEGGLISIALRHYGEAIKLGQRDFDDSPESALKADNGLQLADRLFNRGLFFLLIHGDELAPKDSREQAFNDIRRARDLDYDVKDYMLEHKLLLKNSMAYFSRLLRRINGLADFYDDIGLQEVWDVKELIDDADQLLFAAWNEPGAPIFEELNRVGRLQQLEAAAILLWLRMGNQIEAARLAMRMFSEDEYLLESSFVRAGDALLRLVRSDKEDMSFSQKTLSCTRDDLRRMAKCCKHVTLDTGKCLVFTVELSERWEGDVLLDKINANSLALYDRHCSANDYMGVVAYSTKESLTVELGTKEGNEGRQRTLLDIATSSTTERANPAFPLAIQMVVDSQASLDNDSYILLMLDGYAWDAEAFWSLRQQIDRLNRERSTLIHLFIIGLDMEDENAREQCMQLCSVSKLSMYADATVDTIDGIFDVITAAIAGRPVNNGFLMGITMERF